MPIKDIFPDATPELPPERHPSPPVNRIDAGWEPSRTHIFRGTASGAMSSWIQPTSFQTRRKYRRKVTFGDRGLPKELCGGPNSAHARRHIAELGFSPLPDPHNPPSPPHVITDAAANSPTAT